MKAGVSSLNC